MYIRGIIMLALILTWLSIYQDRYYLYINATWYVQSKTLELMELCNWERLVSTRNLSTQVFKQKTNIILLFRQNQMFGNQQKACM